MPRITIALPENFLFACSIPVRITDLNYGGHVGNATVLALIHEARMQCLRHLGYTELAFAGVGLIMADAGIEFKAELFYGDAVTIAIAAGEFSKVGFELFYKLEKVKEGKLIRVANAKTAMVCYDYAAKRITSLPDEARIKLSGAAH